MRSDRRRSWIAVGLGIAAVDVRCTLRQVNQQWRTIAARAAILSVAWVMFFGGDGVFAIDGAPPVASTRTTVAGLWLFVTATVAMATPRSLDDLRAGTELVLSAGVRPTVLSALVVTGIQSATLFVLFIGAGVLSIAVTTTTGPTLAVAGFGLLALIVGLATAVTAGFALGTAFKPIGRRLPVVSSHPRTVFVPVILLATVGLLRPQLAGPVLTALPAAALADVFLLAYGAGDRTIAIAGLAANLLVLGAFGYASERAARTVWFDRDDTGGGGSVRGSRLVPAIVALTTPVTRRPTRAVATRAWLRMLRKPSTLFQLGIPFVMLGAFLVQNPHDVDWFLTVFVAAFGGISAGLTLTLNPLALEGDALPALLTTPVAGTTVVRGYALVGVLAALPALLGLVVPLGIYGNVPAGVIALTLAWGFAVAVFGALASTAIGFLVPSIGAVASTDTDAPTQAAVIAYTFVGFLTAAPGIAGLLSIDTTAGVALLAADALLLGVLGFVAYTYCARRYESFSLDT